MFTTDWISAFEEALATDMIWLANQFVSSGEHHDLFTISLSDQSCAQVVDDFCQSIVSDLKLDEVNLFAGGYRFSYLSLNYWEAVKVTGFNRGWLLFVPGVSQQYPVVDEVDNLTLDPVVAQTVSNKIVNDIVGVQVSTVLGVVRSLRSVLHGFVQPSVVCFTREQEIAYVVEMQEKINNIIAALGLLMVDENSREFYLQCLALLEENSYQDPLNIVRSVAVAFNS